MSHSREGVLVIVNADDLGGSESINDAIFAAMEDGVITSSTIMATGPALDSAARGTRAFPSISIGVHLNLTDHAPLTRNPHLRPLLNDMGAFAHDAVYQVRWTRPLVWAVIDEWTAQVRRVRQSGVDVSHVDSHHHVHTLPGLFIALKEVQRRTCIRRVRGTWSIYDHASSPTASAKLKKRIWRWALRSVYRTRTTSEFSDFMMFQRAFRERSYAPRRWPRAIELMVHPNGNATESGEEAAALRSNWREALPVATQLVPYGAL